MVNKFYYPNGNPAAEVSDKVLLNADLEVTKQGVVVKQKVRVLESLGPVFIQICVFAINAAQKFGTIVDLIPVISMILRG